jgi:Bacterial regulatory proteins, tetR family
VTTTPIRLTAAERREAMLDAAMAELAAHRYEASSTEEIARRAGIAQPDVFRLFGTKRTSSRPPSSAACLRRSKPSRPLPKDGEGRKRSTRSPPATWSYSTIDPAYSAGCKLELVMDEPGTVHRLDRRGHRLTEPGDLPGQAAQPIGIGRSGGDQQRLACLVHHVHVQAVAR